MASLFELTAGGYFPAHPIRTKNPSRPSRLRGSNCFFNHNAKQLSVDLYIDECPLYLQTVKSEPWISSKLECHTDERRY